MDPSAPGWYPDPYGRHERRYWSGIRWSRHVDDGGHRAADPVDSGPVATVPIMAPQRPDQQQPQHRHSQQLPRQQPQAPERLDRSSRQMPRVELPERSGLPSRQAGPGWVFEPEERRRGSRSPQRRPIALIAGALTIVLLAGAAFVLLRGGGGGEDETPEEIGQTDPVTVAVVADMKERAQGQIPDERAACMADALIGVVGKDRFIELDVLNGADPIVSIDEADKDVGIPKAMECLDNDQMIAFMGATWRGPNDNPFPVEQSHCIFSGWLAGLGRARLIYLYRSFANITQPNAMDVLNEDEFTLYVATAANCANQAVANASTTPTTAAP